MLKDPAPRLVIILSVALLVALAAALHLMGRIAWCTCGLGIWTSEAWSRRTSQDFADPYSFTHILHGLIFYWFLGRLFPSFSIGKRFIIAVLIEVAWEVLENSPPIIERYRAATASLDYFGDSILNSLGDTVFCMVGFFLAARLPSQVSIALALGVELVLLWLIRDNLTLNVLMLIHPVQAIKDWQLAH